MIMSQASTDRLTQVSSVYSGLAELEREGRAAEAAATAARQKALSARLSIAASRSEAETGRKQYLAQLPLLAIGSAELRGFASALKVRLLPVGSCVRTSPRLCA